MYRPHPVRLLFGLLLSGLLMYSGEYPRNSSVIDFLVVISTPVAIVLSKITGWPLQQESGMAVYAWAILITLPLLGALTGLFFGVVKACVFPKENSV